MAGVPYMEQRPKIKGNDVKPIFFSLADKASVLYEYRHRPALWTVLQALFFIKKKKKKKKNSKSVRNHFTVK